MTLGTSPHPLGTALSLGVEAETRVRATLAAGWRAWRASLGACTRRVSIRRPLALRACATVYLFGLAGVLVPAVALTDGAQVAAFGFGHVPIAALVLAGVGLAVAGLRADARPVPVATPTADPVPRGLTGLGDLLAQMSHELRTPLNAVIGFSEVMRHELHGPLNARYQEYAIHIAESGDRMLKSSQDALAVAEAMTVLLGPQPVVRSEAVSATTLVDDAMRAIGLGADQVSLVAGSRCEIVCERRATQQAVEHLLREAASRGLDDARIEVAARRQGGSHGLTIRAVTSNTGQACAQSTNTCVFPMPEAGGLNVLLARLLLEAQGARLEVQTDNAGSWITSVTFGAARG